METIILIIVILILILSCIKTFIAGCYWNHYRALSEELESDLLRAEETINQLEGERFNKDLLHTLKEKRAELTIKELKEGNQ